jgi:hypothetical protein
MSKVLAGLAGLAFAFTAATAAANTDAGTNATLSNVNGNVSVNQGKEFVPAQMGMHLNAGDRVMVPDNGSASIMFDDGCRFDLAEGKIVTVPAKSACGGAKVAQQGVAGQGGGGAAIGDGHRSNTGVWIMVGVVAAIDLWKLNEDDEEITSP